MKKLMFLLFLISTFSGCEIERRIYVHRHPWNNHYRVHRYYAPKPYRKYIAPSKVYQNRNFR